MNLAAVGFAALAVYVVVGTVIVLPFALVAMAFERRP